MVELLGFFVPILFFTVFGVAIALWAKKNSSNHSSGDGFDFDFDFDSGDSGDSGGSDGGGD